MNMKKNDFIVETHISVPDMMNKENDARTKWESIYKKVRMFSIDIYIILLI